MKLSIHYHVLSMGTMALVLPCPRFLVEGDMMISQQQQHQQRLRHMTEDDVTAEEYHHPKNIFRREQTDSELSPIWEAIDAILHGEVPPFFQPTFVMSMMSDPPSDTASSMIPSSIMMTSDTPSILPTSMMFSPTMEPTSSFSLVPTATPSSTVTSSFSSLATSKPTMVVTSNNGTDSPTLSKCQGVTEDQRINQLLAILDTVANPDQIRDNTTPQGLATTWLLQNDKYKICPVRQLGRCDTIVQRWALAVMYFSMNGDDWYQCSANPNATDQCGLEPPFEKDSRFLSPVSYCEWAGITCIDECVAEIEYEANNISGTIPTEIGLLNKLAVWGMERGNLTGSIPTEIGKCSDLIFIDLDFNQLTGTLSPELYSLRNLTQLDINDNRFTGPIDGLGGYPYMEFLQIHRNGFTGTVPSGIGSYTDMTVFTFHQTYITGTVPATLCDLLISQGGVLSSLIADCAGPNPQVYCECCTDCRTSI